MASDLILRLCQVDPDDGGFPDDRHIALHDFTSSMVSVAGGYHTTAQLKTFYDMTAAEGDTLDLLIGKITSVAQLEKRIGRIHRLEAILHFWERKDDLSVSGYDTPDDIETQLMAIDTGFN